MHILMSFNGKISENTHKAEPASYCKKIDPMAISIASNLLIKVKFLLQLYIASPILLSSLF